MAFRFVALLAFVASASAGIISTGPVGYAAPAAYAGYTAPVEYAKQVAYPQQVAYAQPAYHAAPAAVIKTQPILTKAVDEYDPHPQYKFGYDVQDSLSGDSKSQVETRDGDVVQGEYSLIDADGYKRTVQYTADSVHGFNAVVHREPIGVAVKSVAAPAHVAHVATPVAYAAAPTHHVAHIAAPAHVAHVATPVAYAAPAHVSHLSAPVAYAAAPTHHVAHIAAPAQVAYAAGPVVKGAYAVTPVVKAAPVAYPISGHH